MHHVCQGSKAQELNTSLLFRGSTSHALQQLAAEACSACKVHSVHPQSPRVWSPTSTPTLEGGMGTELHSNCRASQGPCRHRLARHAWDFIQLDLSRQVCCKLLRTSLR